MKAAGNSSSDAAMLMIADKLEDMVALQSEAIKNIKIDKVTVWDSGAGSGKDGKTSTAGFLSGLYGSVPPLDEMFNMAGMELPDFLKKKKVEDATASVIESKTQKPEQKGSNKGGTPPANKS